MCFSNSRWFISCKPLDNGNTVTVHVLVTSRLIIVMLQLVLLSPSECDLASFTFPGTLRLHGWFPDGSEGVSCWHCWHPVKALVIALRDSEITKTVDIIAPKCPLPMDGAHNLSGLSVCGVMKHLGQQLEHHWRNWNEFNQTWVRTYFWDNAVTEMAAKKKTFFSHYYWIRRVSVHRVVR